MQKMEAIGQLTGGIAHDFNNMLAVIMGAMDLVQRKLTRGETDIGRFVDAAIDGADARGQPDRPAARLLAPAAAGAAGARRQQARRRHVGPAAPDARRDVSVETVLAGGLWRTYADPSQLENAILNLAVNARDAMPDGGKLTIETANSHLDDSYAARHAEVTRGPICDDRRHRHRHRHDARGARKALRTLLHHQAGGQGHRARPQPGVRLRQAVRRACEDLFGAGRGHDREDLPAAAFRRRAGGAGAAGGRGRQDSRPRPCWWSRTTSACAPSRSMRCASLATRWSMRRRRWTR